MTSARFSPECHGDSPHGLDDDDGLRTRGTGGLTPPGPFPFTLPSLPSYSRSSPRGVEGSRLFENGADGTAIEAEQCEHVRAACTALQRRNRTWASSPLPVAASGIGRREPFSLLPAGRSPGAQQLSVLDDGRLTRNGGRRRPGAAGHRVRRPQRRPRSAKLTTSPSPTTKWSMRRTSTSASASASRLVMDAVGGTGLGYAGRMSMRHHERGGVVPERAAHHHARMDTVAPSTVPWNSSSQAMGRCRLSRKTATKTSLR